MPITLFPDQEYLVDEAMRLTKYGQKQSNVLITSPSGSGKTYIIAGLILQLLEHGFAEEDILVIVPTYEIGYQMDNRIKTALGRPTHLIDIFGSVKASNLDDLIHDYKIIIIDEAHHSEADSYQAVINMWSDAVVYGFTATPMRNDDRELSNTYEHMLSGLSVDELIKAGRLSEFEYYQPDHKDVLSFESDYLHIDGHDYAPKDKDQKLKRTIYGNVVQNWINKAKDRRTIAFTSTIDESKLLADTFKAFGIKAAHVDGSIMDIDTRTHIIEEFRAGRIQVLCNQGLISEGFDVPDTSCVILARPTKSVILHLQQCFRAMRAGGHQKALIFDHANNVSRFGSLNADRGWSLTMDKVQRQLAKKGKKPTSNKGKTYDTDYNLISDAEMIEMANVKNSFFEEDVKQALQLKGMESFEALCAIQRKYKINSSAHGSSWAYMCAQHFKKIPNLTP